MAMPPSFRVLGFLVAANWERPMGICGWAQRQAHQPHVPVTHCGGCKCSTRFINLSFDPN